uniref:LIM zinc-binding domain-containing protein n=1 Tax=Periophthalmus magnuspinnatus TaxID=409849 RepID=A0A3B4ADF1_9GOBI
MELSFCLECSIKCCEFYNRHGDEHVTPSGDVCFFCRKRVYVMERLSAEGKFFHRSCFKCDYCGTTLRLSSYAFDVEDGTRQSAPPCFKSATTVRTENRNKRRQNTDYVCRPETHRKHTTASRHNQRLS